MEEKTVHLLRHAQAYNNVISFWFLDYQRWKYVRRHHLVELMWIIWHFIRIAFKSARVTVGVERTKPAVPRVHPYAAYDRFDPSLTRIGWEQVDERRESMATTKSKVELVVVSPLTRTLQTAAGVFGGGEYRYDETLPPLMASTVGAISSAGSPPMLTVELLRERMSGFPSNKRRRLGEIKQAFPALDFSMVNGEDDSLWDATRLETEKELSARAKSFVEWLWSRPENEIAIVSHGAFLHNMLSRYGEEGIPIGFGNCELRTFKMRKTPAGDIVFVLDHEHQN